MHVLLMLLPQQHRTGSSTELHLTLQTGTPPGTRIAAAAMLIA
jgi:hypothetical protein